MRGSGFRGGLRRQEPPGQGCVAFLFPLPISWTGQTQTQPEGNPRMKPILAAALVLPDRRGAGLATADTPPPADAQPTVSHHRRGRGRA